nr:hypothetical protein [Tanacetum cinerariifolium]
MPTEIELVLEQTQQGSTYEVLSVYEKEPEFEVGDTDTPQGQEGNPGSDNDEPRTEFSPRRAWFTKHSRPHEPTDPD